MQLSTICGVIDRRILVNFRVDPSILAKLLPDPFRPKLVNGQGIAGICLIRLKNIRPKFLPLPKGIGSENAAHRIAVQWEQAGRQFEGVYVLRRDTNSRLNAAAGGRFFPGVHHRARFRVYERDGTYEVALNSNDGAVHVAVAARTVDHISQSSVFASLDEASAFFRAGSVGYSPTWHPRRHDGLELRCANWEMKPLEVTNVESSFFGDRRIFPAGSAALDCALVMRGIQHEWHVRDDIGCRAVR
jgi:uncharacterized protein YqjF (DUF2071 family)